MSEPQISRLHAEDMPYVGADDEPCELVAGELVRSPLPGEEQGWISALLIGCLAELVRDCELGRVYARTGFVLAEDPDTVRGPDGAFVSAERLAGMRRRGPYLVGGPDVVIEVLSPHDRPREIADKVREFLAAGTLAVWVVAPDSRTVTVHAPGPQPIRLSVGDTLDGGAALPGFQLPLGELFED